nr:hypothetical protein [Tanacetum cinerariifolium]
MSTDVGIKCLLDAVGITTAQVCVNTAQMELVLLVNFNEKYTKCLLLLVEVKTASTKLMLLKKVNTAGENILSNYALWEVIENGVTLPKTQVVEGVITNMPITSAEEKAQRRLEEVIENGATLPKTQVVEGVTTVMPITIVEEKAQRRLELKLLDEKLSQEDVNQKLLRSLSPEWNTHVVVWMNKSEVKGMSNSSSSTQNMNFVSSSNNNSSSTNEIVNTPQAVNIANGVSTASTQVNTVYSTNINNLSDVVICSFFANQPSSPQLVHEDLKQINPDDMKEMDLRWQMAMLTMRARRECRALRNQDNKHKESSRRNLVSCDGLCGYDWSDQAEEGPNYALMAFSSLSSDSKVIEFGDSYKASNDDVATGSAIEGTGKKKGRIVALTTEDMQKRKNDVKARTTLLLALPDEHQLRFSKYKTAQELWAAILKTFRGNEATKKTKKNLLKQQHGNFKAEGSETLEQTFNRLQAIVSHLEFMDIEIKQDDLNQKFLTSLAPEWLMHTIVWKNISDLDTMSLDDLYNHLKVYESEVQKKSKSNSQNMVFISSAKNNSRKEDFNAASILTASTNASPASVNIGVVSISQDTACAYIVSQSSGSKIKFEDIIQIDEDDMKEMDIKWNMALLSMRANRF